MLKNFVEEEHKLEFKFRLHCRFRMCLYGLYSPKDYNSVDRGLAESYFSEMWEEFNKIFAPGCRILIS